MNIFRAIAFFFFIFGSLLSVVADQEKSSAHEIAAKSNELLKFLQKAGYDSHELRLKRNAYSLQVKLEDHSADFLVDSGMTDCYLTRRWTKILNLPIEHENKPIKGMYGEVKNASGSVVVKNLYLGGIRIEKLPANLLELPHYDGAIGLNLLMTLRGVLDTRAGVLHLQNPDQPKINPRDFLVDHGFTSLQVVKSEGLLFTPVQIEGKDCLAMIDTGCAVTMVDKSFLEKINSKTRRTYRKITGLDGSTEQIVSTKLASIRFGDYQLEDSLIGATDLSFFRSTLSKTSGDLQMIIGLDYLSSENAILDTANAKLYFKH